MKKAVKAKRAESKFKIDYDVNYSATSIILMYFIFGFLGWIWEVILFAIMEHTFINRGTLYGPFLPIYGTAGIIFLLLTKYKPFKKCMKKPILMFFIIMISCTVLEYFTSFYVQARTGFRYWTYITHPFNLNGRICLEASIAFGIVGLLGLYIVAPFLQRLFEKVSKKIKIIICIVLIVCNLVDLSIVQFIPHVGDGISREIEHNS